MLIRIPLHPLLSSLRMTLGGFECYIISDTGAEGDATLAAEVYTADGEDAEESLLSVSPGCNVLSLVMRDQGIMR